MGRYLRLMGAAVGLQWRLVTRDIETVYPILVIPLNVIVAMAIIAHSGRPELASYALCASLLMTVGQMGFFISSEVVARDEGSQVLELLAASPAPYGLIVGVRTLMLTSLGLIALVEAWVIIRFGFRAPITVHHPALLTATLVATTLAGGFTAILTSALFSVARGVRPIQNAMNGPFYLLGGVTAPIRFLPVWMQPLSPFVFFYWAANLVRDSLSPGEPRDVVLRLSILLGLGVAAGLAGLWVMRRILERLRVDGRYALT